MLRKQGVKLRKKKCLFEIQQQIIYLQKLHWGCFGCHKLKGKKYTKIAYYTRFSRNKFDAVYFFLVLINKDPLERSKNSKMYEIPITNIKFYVVLIRFKQNIGLNKTSTSILIYCHTNLVQIYLVDELHIV